MFLPVKNRFIHCYKFLAFKYFFGFLTPLGDESSGDDFDSEMSF